jgi:hypothetical protein
MVNRYSLIATEYGDVLIVKPSRRIMIRVFRFSDTDSQIPFCRLTDND